MEPVVLRADERVAARPFTSRIVLHRALGGLAYAWAGLVAGISFLEAPVKFTAPSLTLAVGLDVGRHVFGALNRAELVLALASVALVWASGSRRGVWTALGVVWAAVLLQTLWLLPALDARAGVLIGGGTLPPEPALHWLIGIAEVVKVGALVAVGWLTSHPFTATPYGA